jgi:hypothetical protein
MQIEDPHGVTGVNPSSSGGNAKFTSNLLDTEPLGEQPQDLLVRSPAHINQWYRQSITLTLRGFTPTSSIGSAKILPAHRSAS